MFRSVVAALLIPLLAVPVTHAHAATRAAESSKTSRKSSESTRRDEAAETKPAETKPPADAPVQQAEEPSMDFDLLEPSTTAAEAPVQVDPELERAIARRRTMLSIHQGLGIAMAATLAATVVVGQLNFNDRYRGFGDTGKYEGWHTGLVVASSTLFVGTGLLGVLAPSPSRRSSAGTPSPSTKSSWPWPLPACSPRWCWARLTDTREGKLSQVDLATAHQALGYATMGAVTAGALMIVF